MVYGLYVISPVNQRLPPFALRIVRSTGLGACKGAPGPHDFAVRKIAARQSAFHVHRIPHRVS
jgi:hypothetical protein